MFPTWRKTSPILVARNQVEASRPFPASLHGTLRKRSPSGFAVSLGPYSAQKLAAHYPELREVEAILIEFKTHMRGGKIVLRSKTPELVEQEFYGMMLAHRAVRTVMKEAAVGQNLDPDRLSFTHAIRVIHQKLAAMPALSPEAAATWMETFVGKSPLRYRAFSSPAKRKSNILPVARGSGNKRWSSPAEDQKGCLAAKRKPLRYSVSGMCSATG